MIKFNEFSSNRLQKTTHFLTENGVSVETNAVGTREEEYKKQESFELAYISKFIGEVRWIAWKKHSHQR